VISTNAGGLKEINIDGETGYMANVGDIPAMSSKALDILRNDETLKAFKTRAANHAKKYDISNIVPLYENCTNDFYKNKSPVMGLFFLLKVF